MAAGKPRTDDLPWARRDVSDLTDPDLSTIDGLAAQALACRRQGRRLVLVHAPPALRALVAFVGLEDVLRLESPD